MSWRKKQFKSYNRSEVKEDTFYWMELFDNEAYTYWDDYDYDYDYEMWYYYDGPGAVVNMEEYHSMKVLTLLRSLNLREAIYQANARGW